MTETLLLLGAAIFGIGSFQAARACAIGPAFVLAMAAGGAFVAAFWI